MFHLASKRQNLIKATLIVTIRLEAMIGCVVKYDLGARRDRQHWRCDELRCTMGIIITSGTEEYAITNHRNKHKHTTPMFRHKPEILDLRPLSSGPGSLSGCRHWLSVKVRSSRRSHLHPSSPSEETNAVWKAWGNLKIEIKLNTLVLLWRRHGANFLLPRPLSPLTIFIS